MIEIHSTAKKAIEAVKMPYQSIGIRIKVQPAGCNGHTYAMEWCYMKERGDHILEAPKRIYICLLYTSPSPRDKRQSRMPSSA